MTAHKHAEQMRSYVDADRAAQQARKPVPDGLTAVLRGGRQCDEDGTEIIMSRQACVEAADLLESISTQQERKPEQCEWKPEDPDFMPGTYASVCGELWSFIDGGPNENRVRFCHGCGKPVSLKETPRPQNAQ